MHFIHRDLARRRRRSIPNALLLRIHTALSPIFFFFPFSSFFYSLPPPIEGKKIERRSGPLFMRASRDRFLLLFKKPTTAQWTNRPRGAARRPMERAIFINATGNYVKRTIVIYWTSGLRTRRENCNCNFPRRDAPHVGRII